MAHGREWDQGKIWDEDDYDRTKSDNHGGEWKRRKYNNGDYEGTPWPQNYREDERYYDQHQDRDPYQGQSSSDAQRWPAHNRKRHVASDPSPHVIFLGLDPDFTEADLYTFLQGQGYTLETATIIRDRNTGQSKGFGFAQFKSTEDAKSYVDPHFPFVNVPPPASYGASATAAFKKAIEEGVQHNGRRVKIDYSQSANPPGSGRRGPQFANDGTRDIGNAQTAVLLFRGLDPISSTAAIDQAMRSSSGPGKDGAKGMKRIILVKDKVTFASWGFCFVEFVDIQSAAVVLAATMSPQLHPNGFRISDRPVAASFAHPYSFQMVTDTIYNDESCIPSSVHLGGADGGFVKYWDEASSISVLEFDVEELHQNEANSAKERKEKKKVAKDNTRNAQPEASVLPISTKPVTLSLIKLGSASNKPTGPSQNAVVSGVLGFSEQDAGGDEDVTSEHQTRVDDATAQAAKRVAPMVASKKVVNNISKWNQVQEELSGGQVASTSAPAPVVKEPLPVEVEFEFSDPKGLACLLCSRQFKTVEQLSRHNKESDLHKRNFADSNLRDIARAKAKVAKQQQSKQVSETGPKYRDRASERRVLHHQPEAPALEQKPPVRRTSEGPSSSSTPPAPPAAPAPAKDDANIGNKLLKMMGWTEGSGLGNEGDGRVDPIKTAIYASGAGLGASKGKEVGKYTEGYSGYVNMAKDLARERYEG